MPEISISSRDRAKSIAILLAVATITLLLHLVFFGTRFETNDDLAMALAFRGFLSLDGTPVDSFGPVPYLVLWSQFLTRLYRWFPSIPWYALFCLTAMIASLAMASSALRRFLPRRMSSVTSTLVAYGFLFPSFDQTSFTRLSILLLGTALIVAYEKRREDRVTPFFGWLLAALTAACFFIRDLSTAATLGIVSTSAVLLLRSSERWSFLKRVVIPCVGLFVLAAYSSSHWTRPRSAALRLGAHLSDYESCTKTHNSTEENAYIQMAFGYRFIADRDVLTVPRLERAFDELGCGQAPFDEKNLITRARWFFSYLKGHVLAYVLIFSILMLSSLISLRKNSWPFFAASAVIFGALAVCALGFKIEDRIFQPLLAEGALLILIWLLDGQRERAERDEKLRRAVTLGVAALGSISFGMALSARVSSKTTEEQVTFVRNVVAELDEIRKTRDLIVTSDARRMFIPNQMPLFSELIYRNDPALRPLNFVGSWMFHGEPYQELVARIGGTGKYVDFFSALTARPDSLLACSETEKHFLRGYFATFYAKELKIDPDEAAVRKYDIGNVSLKFWKPRFD